MDRQEPTQLTFFSIEWPQWKSLPSHTQQSIVDGLSQMLLQRVEQPPTGHHATTETSTSTMENHDVS